MAYVARLKPYDPRKGQVARSYAHAALDLRFNEGTVARGLSESAAAALRALKQPGKGKAELFDVCTEEEWTDLLAREAAAKLGLPGPVAARVLPGVAAPSPPQTPAVSVPIENLEHTDVGHTRVQHTQAPPPAPTAPAAAAPADAKRPRRVGGTGK
jgi:hypothetical protein